VDDARKGSGPKTVIRGLVQPAGPDGGRDVLPGLAGALIEFSRRIERDARPEPARLADEARHLVSIFEREGRAAGLPDPVLLDARDALIVLVDVRARNNRSMPPPAWRRAFSRALPVAEGLDADHLRRRAAEAERAGASRRDLARFLGHCAEAVDLVASTGERRRGAGGIAWYGVAVAVVVIGLAGWAGWTEWRHREALLATLPPPGEVVDAAAGEGALRRAALLDDYRDAVTRIGEEAARSPLGLVSRVAVLDPTAVARQAYADAAAALIAEPLGEALSVALATEGEPGDLYDTLRALSIVEGRSGWQPGFVAGWITAREEVDPDLVALAPHVAALAGPLATLPPPDPESLGQAREIAAEVDPAVRTFIELERSERALALPEWRIGEALPELASVVVRRSAAPITEGVPGLYTEAGWRDAVGGGVVEAIAVSDAEAAVLVGADGTASPDAVLHELQERTLAAWSDWLSDLRVRPFTDQPSTVLITGVLATRNSPLSALIREVWRQAGGEDRSRAHAEQLGIAATFGPAIQFVEQGRMTEISQLFAALNVTVAALGRTTEVGSRQLMDVRERATSIVALQQAPTLVVQIIEDVLAQSAAPIPEPASDAGDVAVAAGAPGVDPLFRRDVVAVCRAAVEGRYPFAEGPDAEMTALVEAFAPSGRLRRWFTEHAAPLMDMSQPEWRWKPEARLAGRTPESAAFLQRAAAIGDGLFGDDLLPDVALELVALAQRGAATISIGGAPFPVDVNSAAAAAVWPGPDPARGFQIAFEGGDGTRRQGAEGTFGILRVTDGLRLRPRDDGRRFLIDVRAGDARLYFQMRFVAEANPVSVRGAMRGLTCPTTL
jgi:type VI protein secretion system component VasK